MTYLVETGQGLRYTLEKALRRLQCVIVSQGYGDSSSTTWAAVIETPHDDVERLQTHIREQMGYFSGWMTVRTWHDEEPPEEERAIII